MSRSLTAILNEAQRLASEMKDEYVSVEHLFLAALNKDRDAQQFAKKLNLSGSGAWF